MPLENGGASMSLDSRSFQDENVAKLIEEIEKGCEEFGEKRETDVILILMAEEWSSIERETVDDLWMHINRREMHKKGIDVILHSTGGNADAAYHLGLILNDVAKNKPLTFVVPRLAKSAATLLACAGNSIVLTDISELGPIDPQIETRTGRWISVTTVRDALNEIFKMLESRRNLSDRCLDILFRTLPVVEVGQFSKLTEYIKDLLMRTLKMRMKNEGNEKCIDDICKKLTEKYKYHGMPITKEEAKREIGLVIESLPSDIEKVLIEKIYMPFKKLVDEAENVLFPILSVLPFPIVTAKKVESKFGLIYLPPMDMSERMLGTIKTPSQ